jgi:hypothetical protein
VPLHLFHGAENSAFRLPPAVRHEAEVQTRCTSSLLRKRNVSQKPCNLLMERGVYA